MSLPYYEMLSPGPLTTIQDFGRPGLAHYAVPNSGVMDIRSARIAQLLLYQDTDQPLLECTSVAPRIRFHGATHIALTGADFNWTLNGADVALNTVITVAGGDVLAGGIARDGLRGYLALNGTLQLEKIYNSYATYTNACLGGYHGRRLVKGDRIMWQAPAYDFFQSGHIPLQPGPEFTLLAPSARLRLADVTYTISSTSNRMGIRLEGPPLASSSYQLEHSQPVLPGFVQLPPSGQPIVILQDGQSTGGYPRIAYVESRFLPLLNQVPLGGAVNFRLRNDG